MGGTAGGRPSYSETIVTIKKLFLKPTIFDVWCSNGVTVSEAYAIPLCKAISSYHIVTVYVCFSSDLNMSELVLVFKQLFNRLDFHHDFILEDKKQRDFFL